MYKGVDGGKVGQPEAGYIFHQDTDSRAVSSLSDRNEYNSETFIDSSLLQRMSLLIPPTGSTGFV